MGTWIVLAIVLVIVGLAGRSIYKQKKNGGCACSCGGNCGACHGCSSTEESKNTEIK